MDILLSKLLYGVILIEFEGIDFSYSVWTSLRRGQYCQIR